MMSLSRWLAFALSLSTSVLTPPLAKAAPESVSLTCKDFGASTTLAGLKQRFGAANVISKTVPGEEGEGTDDLFVVYPKDKRLQFTLYRAKKGVQRITISGEPGVKKPRSLAGIKIGATLEEVEALNGKPYHILGFGFDGSGLAMDWEDGNLAKLAGGCQLVIRFAPTRVVANGDYDAVQGDKDFLSSSPAMRSVRPTVSTIGFDWN